MPEPTAEVAELVFEGIRKGYTKHAAAAAAGIHRRTLTVWEKKGQEALDKQERGEPLSEQERLHADFLEGLEFAWDLGEANVHDDMNRLAEAGKSTWTQKATVLERTRKESWSKRDNEAPLGRIEIVIQGRPPRETSEVDVVDGHAEEDHGDVPAITATASVP